MCITKTSFIRGPPPCPSLHVRYLQNKVERTSVNNYNSAHMRQLSFYALSIDASDDPALNPWMDNGVLGNSLRSYM